MDLLLFGPGCFAGLEVLASQALAIRIAIQVILRFYDAAVMINHDVIRINLVGGQRAPIVRHFKEIAADAIPRGDIYFVS